uniref:Uncharacterized protein n=1 Tax=viral metagenome TaxID=1070528 RepID=A0A6M3JAU9_9ZZZZ
MTDDLEKITAKLTEHETEDSKALRGICERIGYGRVMQLAEGWMEELHPGWLRARDEVAADRVKKGSGR